MSREDLKNLLLSFSEKDFYANVDMHIHSCISDGKMLPVEIVEQAKKNGKKYICISDHNSIDAYLTTNILSNDCIIPGVEFDCKYNGFLIHILGYGIDIDNEEIKDICAHSDVGRKHTILRLFYLREAKKVIEKIRKAGGIAVLAHPACYWTMKLDDMVSDLIKFGLEGMEIYYPYKGLRRFFKFHSRKEVNDIAEKYNLIKTGGSDTHGRKLL